MFRQFDKIAQNDALVKYIFDHVRNISISCLILSVAAWKSNNLGSGYEYYFDRISSILLSFFGSFLLFINHENLFFKIRGHAKKKWVVIISLIIYSVIFYHFFNYFKIGKF